MTEQPVPSRVRQRRESIETITTKLIYQRQGFVQYMPAVHQKHLGVHIEFPYKFNVQNVQNVDEVADLKFDSIDVEAITENIRRMHYLAVTPYDDLDPDNEHYIVQATPRPSIVHLPEPPYHTLQLQGTEIRLLEVLPGTSGSPINCNLSNASSVHSVEYYALSYVWGDESVRESIRVNDVEISITRNLYDALQSVRHASCPKLLWTDAICIDQANQIEKNAQVAMMGEIYLAAESVYIYLGEPDEHSEYLLQVVEKYQDPNANPGDKVFDSKEWPTILQFLSEHQIQVVQSLVSMISRHWFSRIWVYQEFHLASREPQVFIGSHSVSANIVFGPLFGFLMEVCGSVSLKANEILQPLLREERSASLPPLPQSFAELKRRAHLCRYAVQANDLMPRFPSLWLADPAIAAANATNARDKIFGITGMFDPIAKAVLQPDYGMDSDVVFMRTTAWCLMMDDMDYFIFFRYSFLQAANAPSWTLDFANPLVYDDIEVSIRVDQDKVFPDKDVLAQHCIMNQRILYIQGMVLTTITNTSETPTGSDFDRLKYLWYTERRILEARDTKAPDPLPSNQTRPYILGWVADFPENLISFLVPHSSLYCLLLSDMLPDIQEIAGYSTWLCMQELLGALLFDFERFLQELQLASKASTLSKITSFFTSPHPTQSYPHLTQALLSSRGLSKPTILEIISSILTTVIPTIYTPQAPSFLASRGLSTTDPNALAQTLVASHAKEGTVVSVADVLPFAQTLIYDHANRRDEYAQRLLNTMFFMTECGLAGCGLQSVTGFQKGDGVVFLRKMPVVMVMRKVGAEDMDVRHMVDEKCSKRSKVQEGMYKFVGQVQVEGLIGGSVYERRDVRSGEVELFRIC